MTSPTPPPGWHPDPSEPGLLRYWDGTQWTEHTQSAAEPTAAGPTAAENIPADPAELAATDEPGRTGVPRAVKIVGGIVAAFVVLGVIGAVFGDEESSDDSDAAAPQPTSSSAAPQVTTLAPVRTTPAPVTTTTAVQPTTTTPAPAAGPATYTSDPRCASANQSLVDQVTAGFSESGLTLTNGTVIDAGEYTYVGGTTVDAAGRVENRSDVWVISDGAVYASTGGARNTTTWPKASSKLGISAGDPDVQAVDTCVVELTK
ncbi:DUF2510 domain-containing protein [Rhodococcus sp. BP22]|uniref:DUF2510 domain-containing protein n=1 Tax=Rhodococcus sp. BP22 TaxID=2758566 RepID=UPI001644C933|nr:DUF2510 domain-containing protein [Rhodococcus sp. BP22]